MTRVSAPQQLEAAELATSALIERIRRGIIGEGELMEGPFGPRRVTYADYTASGRSLNFLGCAGSRCRRAASTRTTTYPSGYNQGDRVPALEVVRMCHRVTCRSCGKPSFRGCGQHVEQVLAGVPRSQRCSCDRAKQRPATGGKLSWLRKR